MEKKEQTKSQIKRNSESGGRGEGDGEEIGKETDSKWNIDDFFYKSEKNP